MLAGAVPVPANETEGEEMIETVLGVGHRVADQKGGTLLRVKWDGGSVEWIESADPPR